MLDYHSTKNRLSTLEVFHTNIVIIHSHNVSVRCTVRDIHHAYNLNGDLVAFRRQCCLRLSNVSHLFDNGNIQVYRIELLISVRPCSHDIGVRRNPSPPPKKNPPKRGLDSNSIDIFLCRVSQKKVSVFDYIHQKN